MAITIVTDIPGVQMFVKQPIPIVLHTDANLADDTLRIRLEIYLNPSVIPATLVTLDEKPDSNGNVYFDIAGLLDDFMDEPVSPRADDVAIAFTSPLAFSILVKEVTQATTNIYYPWGNFTTSLPYGTLFSGYNGGLSYQKRTHTYYFTYAKNLPYPPFLTWKPNNIFITKDQVEALPYLIYANTASIKVKIEAFDINNTSLGVKQLGVSGFASKNRVLNFGFGFNASNLADGGLYGADANNIASFDIFLHNNSNVQISEKRRYLIDNRSYRWTKVFGFKNSLGGFEKIYLRGQYSTKGSNTKQSMQIFEATFPDRQLSEYANTESLGATVNTGNLSAAEMRWMRDFFNSTRKFEITGPNAWDIYPITLDSKSIDFPDEKDPLKALKFDYSYSFNNQVWTPEEFASHS